MEEDRELTNLGPENLDNENQTDQHLPARQPKKRFIGNRAAAERAASKNDAARVEDDPGNNKLQTTTTSRTRLPQRLNQIPSEILHDSALNEAIALLPANYNFEIHKTVHRIRSTGATNVALQFPEGLLLFAPVISDILTSFCPGIDTLIMGDVTYGACCVDDYSARALGCDLLIHYGHSCLIPVDTTKDIKTLYVFVTIGIDEEHLIATIERNFQPGKKIALVGTVQFNSTLHSIVPRLRNLGFEAVLPRSAPLSAGEILGCTAPTLLATSASQRAVDPTTDTSSAKHSTKNAVADADMILYVGDGRFHLESILIASPALRAHTYRYDPYTRRLTHETYEHEEMHSLRREAITAARQTLSTSRRKGNQRSKNNEKDEPTTWGIILGTLGRQGNPYTLSLIKAHLHQLGIDSVTLLLSEITPQKLALMSADVAIWVQIACPRLSIDWGYAFPRPLLSPFEACIALGIKDGGSWIEDNSDSKGNHETVSAHDVPRSTDQDDPPVYTMDFYGKDGLGRTKAEDLPKWSMLETQIL